MVLDHVQERFEHSRRKGNRRSVQSLQPPFRGVELEVAEFVDVRRGRLHRGFQNNSEKFSRRLKTFIRASGIFHHAQVRFTPCLCITKQKPTKTVNQKSDRRTRK